MKCIESCRAKQKACEQKECRHWIKSHSELNCVLETIRQNGAMTLCEVGKRLDLSFARVKQIEVGALQKIQRITSKDSKNI